MPTPVGTFTIQTVTDRVLSRIPAGNGEIGVVDPNTPLRGKILKELNLQVAELYKKVNSDEIVFYYVEAPVIFTNNIFNLRSISDYDSFIELREVSYGSIPKTSTMRLETLFNSSYYVDSFACSVYGDLLKIFVGTNLTTAGREFFAKYLRLPNVALASIDLVDLPDNYIEKLIDQLVTVFSSTNEKK